MTSNTDNTRSHQSSTRVKSAQPERARLRNRMSLRMLLTCWFLIIGIVPLTLIASIGHYNAKQSLRRQAFDSLHTIAAEKAAFLNNWFNYRFIDLESQVSNKNNVRLMSKLGDSFEASENTISDFVKSDRWKQIVSQSGDDIPIYLRLYGYYDLLLIDLQGNVLYSAMEEADIGTNLLHGPYAETVLAKAFMETLDTGRSSFSDLDYYAPSNGDLAGFLASIVYGDNNERIGVLALQLPLEKIQQALGVAMVREDQSSTYLIGFSPERGVTLRTAITNSPASSQNRTIGHETDRDGPMDFLNQRVDTVQTRAWADGLKHGDAHSSRSNNTPTVYVNPSGERVLGVCEYVRSGTVQWGLIAEVSEDAAFAGAKQLKSVAMMIAALTGAAIIFMSLFIAGKIARPIVALSHAADRVARGDFATLTPERAVKEIGHLAESFNRMTTHINEHTQELCIQKQELELKNEEMEQFTYSASHDMKSPLITVLGYVGFLKQDINAERHDRLVHFTDRISEGANQMQTTIDDLLELSRIGRAINESETIDAHELVSQLLFEMKDQVAEANVIVTIRPDIPPVHADRVRLTQVLQNLIRNAIKHGRPEHGDSRITVGGEVVGNEVQLFVADNGPGIREEYQEKIFGLFERLHNDKDGTGIGLALVKRAALVHGGRAWVESTPGEGATFFFAVPVTASVNLFQSAA